MKTNELQFTEKKSMQLRNEYITRTEVLDKVKKLFLIPELEVMTFRQIAEFYEVDLEAIRTVYRRHRREIDEDGTINLTKETLMGRFDTLGTGSSGTTYKLSDKVSIKIPNRGTTGFSKRAILRIGMLLRDSEVAKEVRTQLLNTFENSTNEVKVSEINEELAIQKRLGEAMFSGDANKITEAMAEAMAYKNRHIEALNRDNSQLKQKNENLNLVNQGLTKNTLKWDNPKMLNKAIRLMASARKMSYATQWNEFYNEMLYKHGIALRQRNTKPPIKAIKKNEWDAVWQTVTAICERRYLNTAEILKKAKIAD